MIRITKYLTIVTISVFSLQSCGSESHNEADGSHSAEEHSETASTSIAKDVQASEFTELINSGKGTLVDVRTPGEYAGGHIGDAMLIDYTNPSFSEEIQKLDKDQPVYVYCASGNRSGKAMQMMKNMGFKEVYNLIGGYHGYPK